MFCQRAGEGHVPDESAEHLGDDDGPAASAVRFEKSREVAARELIPEGIGEVPSGHCVHHRRQRRHGAVPRRHVLLFVEPRVYKFTLSIHPWSSSGGAHRSSKRSPRVSLAAG